MLHYFARRICAETVAALEVILRANRARIKTTAAVGADIFQDLFDAGTAESAFEGADHRLDGIWRKRSVAVLAGGS